VLKERTLIQSLDLPGGSSTEDLFDDLNPIGTCEVLNGSSYPSKIYSDDKRTLLVLLHVLFALYRRINRNTSTIKDTHSTKACNSKRSTSNGLVGAPTKVINH
jgi:hypothetical protein